MKAIIEMHKGTFEKTELDKKTGTLKMDRRLAISVPANYGFIDKTLAEDGDPLDVFVLGPSIRGLTEVDVTPIGVFFCSDQGIPDHKILACLSDDVPQDLDKAIGDIRAYLTHYKEGFKVLSYSEDLMLLYRVYRKARVKTQYHHDKLSPWGLLAIFGIGAALAFFDWLSRK